MQTRDPLSSYSHLQTGDFKVEEDAVYGSLVKLPEDADQDPLSTYSHFRLGTPRQVIKKMQTRASGQVTGRCRLGTPRQVTVICRLGTLVKVRYSKIQTRDPWPSYKICRLETTGQGTASCRLGKTARLQEHADWRPPVQVTVTPKKHDKIAKRFVQSWIVGTTTMKLGARGVAPITKIIPTDGSAVVKYQVSWSIICSLFITGQACSNYTGHSSSAYYCTVNMRHIHRRMQKGPFVLVPVPHWGMQWCYRMHQRPDGSMWVGGGGGGGGGGITCLW